MNLTRYTDYSLRVLLLLALRRDERVSIQQISDTYGISRNHLLKVVNRLGHLGYVETVRGRGGGLRLQRDPGGITVGEIVRHMEPSIDLLDCFVRADDCPITPACRLKGVLGEARDAFFAALDRHTIANLASNRRALEGLLPLADRRS